MFMVYVFIYVHVIKKKLWDYILVANGCPRVSKTNFQFTSHLHERFAQQIVTPIANVPNMLITQWHDNSIIAIKICKFWWVSLRSYEIRWDSMTFGEIRWDMLRFGSKYAAIPPILDNIEISNSPY